MKGVVDDDDFESVAQRAHFLFGAIIPILATFMLSYKAAFFAVPPFLCWAAWKEFYYDNRYETDDERGSNWVDFRSYCFGVIIGATIVFIKLKVP